MERKQFLTANQFLKLPLSVAIHHVIAELDYFIQRGVTINMSTYYDCTVPLNYLGNQQGEPKLCSVCLGGAAVLGLLNNRQEKHFIDNYECDDFDDERFISTTLKIGETDVQRIKGTFDYARSTQYLDAFEEWYKIDECDVDTEIYYSLNQLEFKSEHRPIRHEPTNAELLKLKKQLIEFSDLLIAFNK